MGLKIWQASSVLLILLGIVVILIEATITGFLLMGYYSLGSILLAAGIVSLILSVFPLSNQ